MRRMMLVVVALVFLTFLLPGCTGDLTTPRYSPHSENGSLATGENRKGEWTSGGAMAGRVIDAVTGQPLKDATVAIPGSDLTTDTDVDGIYLLVNIPQGIFTVTVRKEGYQTIEERTFVLNGRTTTNDYELHSVDGNPSADDPPAENGTQSGTLRGRVSNSHTGMPLAGAEVHVDGTALTTRSDHLGRYTLANIPAGMQLRIVAHTAGYREATTIVTVQANRTSRVNLVLAPLDSPTPTPSPSPSPNPTPSPTPTPSPSPTPTPEQTSTPSSTNDIPIDLLIQYGWGRNNVVRWKDGVVDVYDATNDSAIDVGAILDTWNGAINGPTTFRLSRNSQSPVTIYYDADKVTSYGSGTWGVATVWWRNYELVKAEVAILPCGTWYGNRNLCPTYELYKHELGHVVGFGGHTNDGGVMDAVANGSRTVTKTVRDMLHGLYQLPIGYTLTRGPGVPPDGMAVMPMRSK